MSSVDAITKRLPSDPPRYQTPSDNTPLSACQNWLLRRFRNNTSTLSAPKMADERGAQALATLPAHLGSSVKCLIQVEPARGMNGAVFDGMKHHGCGPVCVTHTVGTSSARATPATPPLRPREMLGELEQPILAADGRQRTGYCQRGC